MSLNFDHIAAEPYPEALYRPDLLAEPIDGWGSFDDSMDEQYRTLGFVSVANAFSADEVAAAVEALSDLVAAPSLPPETQLQFEGAGMGIVENLAPEERLDYVRKFMWFSHLREGTDQLMRAPAMMEVVERLLGGPARMFQDMALLKPPGLGREKPWHQDHAYFKLPKGAAVVGVWISLDKTFPENGCMHFLPGRHVEGPLPHWSRRDWQICDSDILAASRQVAVPLPPGGCVVFDGLVPHGTPSNRTNTRRRAVQYHYCLADVVDSTDEERLRIFGSEGSGATC